MVEVVVTISQLAMTDEGGGGLSSSPFTFDEGEFTSVRHSRFAFDGCELCWPLLPHVAHFLHWMVLCQAPPPPCIQILCSIRICSRFHLSFAFRVRWVWDLPVTTSTYHSCLAFDEGVRSLRSVIRNSCLMDVSCASCHLHMSFAYCARWCCASHHLRLLFASRVQWRVPLSSSSCSPLTFDECMLCQPPPPPRLRLSVDGGVLLHTLFDTTLHRLPHLFPVQWECRTRHLLLPSRFASVMTGIPTTMTAPVHHSSIPRHQQMLVHPPLVAFEIDKVGLHIRG